MFKVLRKWLECIHCISDMKLIWKQISDKSLTDWTSPMLYSFYASVSKNMSRCCLHLIPVTHPCFGNILGCTLTNQLLNWKQSIWKDLSIIIFEMRESMFYIINCFLITRNCKSSLVIHSIDWIVQNRLFCWINAEIIVGR